jgi:tetratricopeptide (TPR) repeat protein
MYQSLPKELSQANQFIIEGKFEESLQLLKEFEERRNNSLHNIVSCHLIKCNLFLHQGLSKKLVKFAEQTYKESLGLEKSILSVDALIFMARGLINSFNVKPATKIIKQAEELLATLTEELVINKNRRVAYISFLKGKTSDPLFTPKGDIDLALKYYNHSLALGESLGDELLIGSSLLSIAWGLGTQKGEIDNALEYVERTLAFAKEANYKVFISYGFLRKASFYGTKGEVTRSIPLFEQSLAIAKELNHNILISSNLNNVADAYRMIGDLDRALECSEQSLALISKIGSLKSIAMIHDFLIQILIEKGDLEQAQQYFNHLEQLNNQLKDKTINLACLYNRALLLKESPRISNRGKAEEILKQILEDEDILWELKERALLTLCELLLIEFQMTNELEVIDELESRITQLLENAEKSRSYWILCETYLLRAKITLISSDLEETRRLLAKGQQIAEKYGLTRLAMSISEEHDKLLNELSLWEGLKESNAPMGERIELARLADQINHMTKKRVMEYPKLKAEQPILFAIMTKEGEMVLSSPFTADMTIDETHFGEFLTSCNAFCDQITHFCDAINKDPILMKFLENIVNENKTISINEHPSLEELIVESFLSDPQKFQMPFEAYEGDEPFVFASYSHTDKLQVYPIIDYLNKIGLNIWYDEGIPISENWKKSIVENLDKCNAFLVFVTPHIIDSEYVRKEINYAMKMHKPFFTIYLKETELPHELMFDMDEIQAMKKYLMPETEFYDKLRNTLFPVLHG